MLKASNSIYPSQAQATKFTHFMTLKYTGKSIDVFVYAP